ncbi:MAG: GNAT family N-acetyltransferase [Gammaproteobacteria bacterium]|nr:GNAT family N-acetyltransferase [Gammaproteobacteria bacterium]
MSSPTSFEAAIWALSGACTATRHRRLVVLAGESAWATAQAQQALATLPGTWCWIGEAAGEAVDGTPLQQAAVAQAHTLLGGEWQGLIYDARAGFDPDAFGAVAGTLRAGGLLLLLTPSLSTWPDYPDPQRHRLAVYPYDEAQVGGRFLQRLATLLQESRECFLIEQGKPLPPLPLTHETSIPAAHMFGECATAEQLAAVEALCRVAQGHRHRPLVLVSDRGRGKSAALGLAAARLLQQGVRRIVVTAPRLAAVEQLFQHAAAQLSDGELGRGLLRLPDGAELRFEPPDRVVHGANDCELLLVDEAAAIPTSLLEPMLRRHARIAFATTVHGYEGTGRGFDLRFRQVLDAVTPEWRRRRLEQPIRWAAGDPLEQLVFRLLLLDAEPVADAVVAELPLEQCRIERLDRDALTADEALLSQLFALLVQAHYRTSPGDLRNLLDGPNLEIYLLRHRQSVVGCALVAREGGLDAVLAQQVYAGARRLRGNLLPQSLATHAGLVKAPLLTAARVMRIAIHPACQGRGLGRRLIKTLAAEAATQGVDYLGASFGGDPRLFDFWRGCDCLPVRLGLKREASSGAHALMVMRPLSPQGEQLCAHARQRLATQLPVLLSEPLAGLEPGLAVRLLQGSGTPPADEMAWADAGSFAFTQRDYGNCLSGLQQVLLFALSDAPGVLTGEQQALAIAKVLQRHPWPELVQSQGLAGRSEAIAGLREVFRVLCRYYQAGVNDGVMPSSEREG